MKLKHRVALAGVQLDSIDDRIMITKVEEADGKEQLSTVSLWGGSGSRVTEMHRDSLDVKVSFVVKLRKREMAGREEVVEKVNAWAMAGGWLTTNYKTNRRLRVFLQQAASIGDPWNWTKEMSVNFRACGVPYWQESNGASATFSGTEGTVSMTVNGSAETVANVSFQNTSGSTCDTFEISTGDAVMSFSGLGLANGETLVIDHTDNGKRALLRIRIQESGGTTRSAMGKRSADSDNDLYITPGSKTVTFTAGKAGSCTVTVNGRFA